MPHPEPPPLGRYRAKRQPGTTPEPFGAGIEAEGGRPRVFVVQQHAARRLHFDLRLEMDGVLRSWAVPKGPSLDPREKRLAVATEDHPMEYADFEGVIPEGNYGAGAMIVWDRGRWVPREDPDEGYARGKLLFELEGFKLRGLWTLVRTKGDDKEWLLIKKPDAWSREVEAADLDAGSVLSGLKVEELAAGADRGAAVRRELEALGAPRREVEPDSVAPMLAEVRNRPFSRRGWIFELKYDGYRLLAAKGEAHRPDPGGRRAGPAVARGPGARLLYRRGREATRSFPELVRAVAALPYGSLVMDGEVVVLDEEARPSFQRLQQRAQLARPRDAERAALESPATLYLFDLLAFEGHDLRPLPLAQRKQLLRRILPASGPLAYTDHVEERGEELYAEVERIGLEGIVAKKADSPYRSGRSRHWLKMRADRVEDFAVVGYTRPEGSRSGFGALHLGIHEGEHLVYAGRVGSGFSEAQLAAIREALDPLERPDPTVAGAVPSGPEHAWVEPRMVVEVRFKEYTGEGLLRQPVFVRLRDDKAPEECVRRGPGSPAPVAGPAEAPAAALRRTATRAVRFTNLEKVFWPDTGHTKGDLIEYYRAIAPWLLPYLQDRPVVLDRYPDGIEGKSFYQKNAPDSAPDWIRTVPVWSEDSQREIEYFLVDGLEPLLYLANLAAIPLHVWSSRVGSLERPDWCVLDLDPKGARFAWVVEAARAVHDLCHRIELECFAKTSGSQGMHVLIPLAGRCTHEQSRQLGELLARVVARRLPETTTVERVIAARRGRVYLDFLQNGFGKLIVAPFSARPLPGAPASAPLRWREVRPRLDPSRFTIASLPARMRRLRGDPMAPLLTTRCDLGRALGRLAEVWEQEASPR